MLTFLLEQWFCCPQGLDGQKDYEEARTYKNAFRPKSGVKYGWVSAFGKDAFLMDLQAYRAIDDKADAMLRYVAGGIGVAAFASVINVSKDNVWIFVLSIPSFMAAMRSVYFAIKARTPVEVPFPPGISNAIRFAEEYGETAEAQFLGQWHMMHEGMDIVLAAKSENVARSLQFFTQSVFMMALPLAWAISWAIGSYFRGG